MSLSPEPSSADQSPAPGRPHSALAAAAMGFGLGSFLLPFLSTGLALLCGMRVLLRSADRSDRALAIGGMLIGLALSGVWLVLLVLVYRRIHGS